MGKLVSWESTKEIRFEKVVTIMWKDFEKVFLYVYFAQHLQEMKRYKFVDHHQGGMLVDEYTSRFHNLEHFYSNINPTRHS